MTTRLTPERFAEILVEFNRVLNSARQEHHALCARSRMGRELIAEVVALREERDALQAKASEVPGLTAALDDARWERDVAKGEQTAGSQALKEIERLVAELDQARDRLTAIRAYVDNPDLSHEATCQSIAEELRGNP